MKDIIIPPITNVKITSGIIFDSVTDESIAVFGEVFESVIKTMCDDGTAMMQITSSEDGIITVKEVK